MEHCRRFGASDSGSGSDPRDPPIDDLNTEPQEPSSVVPDEQNAGIDNDDNLVVLPDTLTLQPKTDDTDADSASWRMEQLHSSEASSSSSTASTSTNSRDYCCLCLNQYEAGEVLAFPYGCVHNFHYECIMPWFRQRASCPLCRGYVHSFITRPCV